MNFKRPNIILITIDSLRKDYLGIYNPEKKISPYMDKISKNSLIFNNAIVPSLPTFFVFPSIISGIEPFEFGDYLGIPKNKKTIGEILKGKGYSTAAFIADNPALYGKLYGYNKGFDYFYDGSEKIFQNKKPSKNFFKKIKDKINKYPQLKKYIFGIKDLIRIILKEKGVGISSEELNKKILNFLSKSKKEGIFLWIHYMDVHTPYNTSNQFKIYKNPIKNLLIKFKFMTQIGNFIRQSKIPTKKDLEITKKMYEASITNLDKNLGFLIQKIKRNLGENTYIIITSDHGEAFMEHGFYYHMPHILHCELTNIPLIINGPNINKTPVNKMVSLINIPKTISEIANIKSNLKGFNLLKSNEINLNKYEKINNTIKTLYKCDHPHFKIFDNQTEIKGHPYLKAIIRGNKKYIFNQQKLEIYDLKNDPLEKNPLKNKSNIKFHKL